jgi:signal transduction histidine kinase/PAS domain-containing protein
VRICGAAAGGNGVVWLTLWLAGVAGRWSVQGAVTMKTNMALCLALGGGSLLLLASPAASAGRRWAAGCLGALVLLIGGLTLSEHLLGCDLGIDQLLAAEQPGAAATTAPNRMGLPGSSSLVLLGAGLLALSAGRRRWVLYFALGVCLVNLTPLVGFLYGIDEFHSKGAAGIALPTVATLLVLGAGLILTVREAGPMALLTRDDPGGALLRRLLPAAIVIPLVLGFAKVQMEHAGFWDSHGRTGLLIVLLVIMSCAVAWRSAAHLSRSAAARLAAEEALLEAGERAASLARFPEENPNPVVRVSVDGRAQYCNPACRKLTGWPREAKEILQPALAELVREALAGRTELQRDVDLAGRTYAVSVMPTAGGDCANIYGRDVTARIQAEQSLRESQERLKIAEATRVQRQRLFDVMEALPVYVVLLSPDYRVPFANRFFRERFGESNGRRCYEYLFGRSEPCEVCETYKVLKTGQAQQWEWTGPDGRDYDIHDFPFTDTDGSPLIMEMGIDVTDRKRAEAELRRHHEHLAELVRERTAELERRNAELASEVMDRERAEEAMRHSLARFGLLTETAGELLASPEPRRVVDQLCRKVMEHLDCDVFFNFMADGEAGKLRLNAWAGISPDEAKKTEWLEYGVAVCGCAARDGCRIVAEHIPTTGDPRTELVKSYGVKAYACHPLMGPGGKVLGTLSFGARGRETFSGDDLAMMKAVADQVAVAMVREQGEEAMRRTAEELRRSNLELEQFAYIASHDLQEPLRMVTGFMGRIRERYADQLDAKGQEFIGYAVDGAQRMSELIKDLLAYSRVQRSTQPFVEVDAGAVFAAAAANCRASIQACGAEVTCGELPTVRGTGTQLTQLLQNLIGNAVKFRRPGVRPEVRVSARREGEWWVFEVKDNGIGIAAGQRERVFQIFQRLHTRDKYPGTGIGLAICKRIVERHGGRIWVESTPGEGSEFLFTLPQ